MDYSKNGRSPSDVDSAAKRRKSYSSVSSSPPSFPSNHWHPESPWATSNFLEIMLPYSRLPYIVETDNRLNEIREEMKNLYEQETQLLIDQEESSKREVQQLQRLLTEQIRENNELRQKITDTLSENIRLRELIFQQTTEGTSERRAPADKITELQLNLNSDSLAQEEIDFQMNELKDAKMKIQELESEKISLREELQELAPRAKVAKELEKRLQLAEKIISKLRGVDAKEEPIAGGSSVGDGELGVDRTGEEVMGEECETSGQNNNEGEVQNGETAEASENESRDSDDNNCPSETICDDTDVERTEGESDDAQRAGASEECGEDTPEGNTHGGN
ncbi:uncharacterized protein LOC107043086 [Diachasma alloeum]|uniref:uncharacterized protein LOC107043086 n=1 Tax=Diachasma alloeum TaxID=454923 RepID=UPI0007382085|nr:uncharacterized protein LOC107043086 [Diachasma alloeum]